ncbi:MAG: hypothetical protein ACRDZ3_16245 [Acidimicrobiia bacterium]
MPMRTDCKNYESRTYPSGDSVRKCNLDLAPEAPWRCPENCPAYEMRLVDAGWTWGDLNRQGSPKEPPLTEESAALLDHAEDIVNSIGPEILEEFKRLEEQRSKSRSLLGRFPRPKGNKGNKGNKGKKKRR